jgi:hypothetical protein
MTFLRDQPPRAVQRKVLRVINGDRSNHERVCRAAKASMRFFGDRQMALRARGFAWLAARSRLDGARGAAHVKSMQLARAPLGCRDPPRRKR